MRRGLLDVPPGVVHMFERLVLDQRDSPVQGTYKFVIDALLARAAGEDEHGAAVTVKQVGAIASWRAKNIKRFLPLYCGLS